MSHIEELTQRLDEQEDIINKHEKIIARILPQPQVQLQPQFQLNSQVQRDTPSTKTKLAVKKEQSKPSPQQQKNSQERVHHTQTSQLFENVLPQHTTVIHMSSPFSVPPKMSQSQKIRFSEENEPKIREEKDDDNEEENEDELDSEINTELKDLLGIDDDDGDDDDDDEDDDGDDDEDDDKKQ